ncbi:pimeloyl-ACP methyl ester carboxylesterase [Nonomuraea polychroma]|uniref:Pimeloyl-ACP methyl ester carboxylesterase n=1 Tax=Nonomuraea polychroma TaxID=46176 RepID=A0A438MGN5_9ACTN|nr:alpha/beta fold hydrolase [Nonomuraea polychroma]RVX45002.1 pimeloyl-ACP methyl ester carboxylesterase [Nonomuraea polychroma]
MGERPVTMLNILSLSSVASAFTPITRLGAGVLQAGTQVVEKVCDWAGGLPAAVLAMPAPLVNRGRAIPPVAPSATGSFVEVRPPGLATMTAAYERRGTGEPVVLLHGLGSNRQAWDAVVPLLTVERDVITVDLPGFGESPDLPDGQPRDLATLVAGLGAVFTALGLERPHVVGHSLGGLIALRLGQAGLARSVTSVAPAGFWSQTERWYAFAILTAARQIARLPEPITAWLSQSILGHAVLTGTLYMRADQSAPEAVAASLRALRQAVAFQATMRAGRARDLFAGDIPDVPVTIAWGTADRVLPARQAARAAAMIPMMRMVWLPGCSHVPMNDAPQLVAQVILQATAPSSTAERRGADSKPEIAIPRQSTGISSSARHARSAVDGYTGS